MPSESSNNENLLAVVASDLPKSVTLLSEIKEQIINTTKSTCSLSERLSDSQSTSKGISFLETKHHTLLSYLINLTQLLMMKLNGEKVNNSSTIDRLIEYRVVLERMRPIDQKLKYQIDKLLRVVSSGTVDTNDPLQFKANPENLVNKMEEGNSEDDDDDSDTEKTSKKDIYVPPKLTAMPYDEIEEEERKSKSMERAKKKLLSSSIMEDLRKEYYDGPEEIKERVNEEKVKVEENRKHRIEYEEDNFVRLTVSKKEKNAGKKLSNMSSLGKIAKFEDLSALDGDSRDDVTPRKRSKSKSSVRGKKSSKKRRKYH